MVVIKPFKAIRPKAELAAKIATLPYDVLDSEEAADLARENVFSYLHIDKAEIDLPADLSPYDDKVYEKAADSLQDFQAEGWLKKDAEPCLYLYELTMLERVQTGLVVCTSIEDYLENRIKKHEFTRPEKELDRIRHSDACDGNTSPIFLTYRKQAEIDQLIQDWKQQCTPVYDFTSFHEVHHRVWVIDDLATIQALEAEFSEKVSALYIADGHHRTESAVKVGQKRLADFSEAPDDAEFRYFLSVLFPKEELEILDYNRVLNVTVPTDLLEILAADFSVQKTAADQVKPLKAKTFGMYLNGQWYELTARDEIIPADVIGNLDVSILQKQVFEKIFGIEDIRTDKRIDFVGGIRGLDELVRLVDDHQATIAFALYPTTMDDLLKVADAGKIMPPKSTWFEPKLLSGLFIHDFETKNK